MEQLTNCPNCGAILDDLGRCKFCGSKVYDFCDIDVSPINRNRTYIRIKTGKATVIAPIMTHSVSMELSVDALPTMNVEFAIVGDTIVKEDAE